MVTTRILIVEQNRALMQSWRNSLAGTGYEVVCCGRSDEALACSRPGRFDLVIIGHQVSQLSGTELFCLIRDREPNIIGVMVLEERDLDLVVQAMNSGFSRVLEKSVQEPELVPLIREVLDLCRLRRENTRLSTLLPLYDLGRKFLVATSVEQIYQELIEVVANEMHVSALSLMIFDKQSDLLRIVASKGLSKEVVETFSVRPGEKISGRVFEMGKPIIFNKQTQDQTSFSRMLNRSELSASISFPLVGRKEVLGVLNISQTRDEMQYSQADLEMLSVICSQAVMALENIRFISRQGESIRVRALLEQYMAPEVADLLVNNTKDVMQVGGVQKITVLYADIRNFTLLVQTEQLADLRCFLNAFFKLLADVVFSARGTLDKFIGDAVLVVFGAPVELEEPSQAAVLAAQQILKKFDLLQKEWIKHSDVFKKTGLGIGIARGEMFLGNVGSARRFDYTVIGSDVNIAQRLASQAKSGQILITSTVRADMGDCCPIQGEEARLLKGFGEKIKTYSLASE